MRVLKDRHPDTANGRAKTSNLFARDFGGHEFSKGYQHTAERQEHDHKSNQNHGP